MDWVAARYRFVASNAASKRRAAMRRPDFVNLPPLLPAACGWLPRGTLHLRDGRLRCNLPEDQEEDEEHTRPNLKDQAVERGLHLPRGARGRNEIDRAVGQKHQDQASARDQKRSFVMVVNLPSQNNRKNSHENQRVRHSRTKIDHYGEETRGYLLVRVQVYQPRQAGESLGHQGIDGGARKNFSH